jgi:hypothetical protein
LRDDNLPSTPGFKSNAGGVVEQNHTTIMPSSPGFELPPPPSSTINTGNAKFVPSLPPAPVAPTAPNGSTLPPLSSGPSLEEQPR